MSGDTLRPEWPTSKPDAATLIRYFAGSGQFFLGVTWGYVGKATADDPLAFSRYMTAVHAMQHAHDIIVALKALADVDRAAADRVANRIWGAADAGDTRAWAMKAFDEQRRLGERCSFLARLAISKGATHDELLDPSSHAVQP